MRQNPVSERDPQAWRNATEEIIEVHTWLDANFSACQFYIPRTNPEGMFLEVVSLPADEIA
jgi:hypothetical protein